MVAVLIYQYYFPSFVAWWRRNIVSDCPELARLHAEQDIRDEINRARKREKKMERKFENLNRLSTPWYIKGPMLQRFVLYPGMSIIVLLALIFS